ncbi:MAG: hypothetical protein RJB58_38, partial [Pseudomonadota bacterium]
MTGLGFEDIIAGLDPDVQEMFGQLPALKNMRDAQKLQDEARRAVAVSMAAIAATPDGERVLDYLVGAYIRRFNNVTALCLPMETAIQLHAERDGGRELVNELLRLVADGRKATS